MTSLVRSVQSTWFRPTKFFFFQAEDGIRDVAVTGVQTCALPICRADEPADQLAREPARWVAPDRGGSLRPGAAEPVPDDRGQLSHGPDGGTHERSCLVGRLRSPSRGAFRSRRGWRRLGTVLVLALRPGVRLGRSILPCLSARHSPLLQANRVR